MFLVVVFGLGYKKFVLFVSVIFMVLYIAKSIFMTQNVTAGMLEKWNHFDVEKRVLVCFILRQLRLILLLDCNLSL